MNRVRSSLARALAVLLLVQWAVAPVHCLLLAAASGEGAFICHAGSDDPQHPANGGLPSDQCCAACPALAGVALPVVPAATPQRLTWFVFAPQRPRHEVAAPAAYASPHQARAPPALPV